VAEAYILPLHGIPCASCSVPARSHNFETGQTYYVNGRKPPCQTQIPRR
jgi:hypothetical protein